jgi:hypothetical protein
MAINQDDTNKSTLGIRGKKSKRKGVLLSRKDLHSFLLQKNVF